MNFSCWRYFCTRKSYNSANFTAGGIDDYRGQCLPYAQIGEPNQNNTWNSWHEFTGSVSYRTGSTDLSKLFVSLLYVRVYTDSYAGFCNSQLFHRRNITDKNSSPGAFAPIYTVYDRTENPPSWPAGNLGGGGVPYTLFLNFHLKGNPINFLGFPSCRRNVRGVREFRRPFV